MSSLTESDSDSFHAKKNDSESEHIEILNMRANNARMLGKYDTKIDNFKKEIKNLDTFNNSNAAHKRMKPNINLNMEIGKDLKYNYKNCNVSGMFLFLLHCQKYNHKNQTNNTNNHDFFDCRDSIVKNKNYQIWQNWFAVSDQSYVPFFILFYFFLSLYFFLLLLLFVCVC